MKTILRNFLLVSVVLSVPAVLYAAISAGSNYLDISGWGFIGSANNANSNSGVLAVGLNNMISVGPSDMGTATIGSSLRSYYPNCLVVGRFNTNATGASPSFIVGNGTDTNNRQNAVEVWGDGTVYMPQGADIKKVPARGGISMGGYTTN